MKKGVKFDYKQAYNKNLKPSARLHYLENARHDQDSPAKKYDSPAKKSCSPMKMGGHAIHKHMGGSPFLKAQNPDLEYMPVEKDATGGRDTSGYGKNTAKRPGVSTLVYDYADKYVTDLSAPDKAISSKKPSSAKPTRSELRKSRRANRIAGRIQKKIDIGTRKLEAGNKIGARDKARRVARMQKRANRLLK